MLDNIVYLTFLSLMVIASLSGIGLIMSIRAQYKRDRAEEEHYKRMRHHMNERLWGTAEARRMAENQGHTGNVVNMRRDEDGI
jgi:hypothetical protein